MSRTLKVVPDVARPSTTFRPSIYWYLSFRCNLACRHCSVNSSPTTDTSGDLSTSEAMQVIDQLEAANVAGVILTGGEPLYRDDAREILRELVARRINSALETNGLLIDEEVVRIVSSARASGVGVNISVSLDGGNRETHEWLRGLNTFHRTIENLRRLKEANIRFNVQCIVHQKNKNSIVDLFDEMRRLLPAVDRIVLGFLHPVGRGIEMWDPMAMTSRDLAEMYDLIASHMSDYNGRIVIKVPPAMIPPRYLGSLFGDEESRCACNTTCSFPTLGILPNGDVTVCALTRNDPSIKYGNIRTDTLPDICVRANLGEARTRYLAAQLRGICGDCVFAQTCKGACRALAYDQYGDFAAPHPLCAGLDRRGEFPAMYRKSAQVHVAS
ncbi:MAG: radical SAM protein [Vicinamibacterales bacterium]